MSKEIKVCYHCGDSPMEEMEDGNFICEMCRAVTFSDENWAVIQKEWIEINKPTTNQKAKHE